MWDLSLWWRQLHSLHYMICIHDAFFVAIGGAWMAQAVRLVKTWWKKKAGLDEESKLQRCNREDESPHHTIQACLDSTTKCCLHCTFNLRFSMQFVSGGDHVRLPLFETYWKSGAALIGEEGCQGWQAWALSHQNPNVPPPPPPPDPGSNIAIFAIYNAFAFARSFCCFCRFCRFAIIDNGLKHWDSENWNPVLLGGFNKIKTLSSYVKYSKLNENHSSLSCNGDNLIMESLKMYRSRPFVWKFSGLD